MNPNQSKEKPKLLHVKNATCLYRQSHNGMYYFQGQINGKKFTHSLHTTDRAAANRALRVRREKLERLDYASGKMALAALCERYRNLYQNQASETVKQKDRIVKRIVDDWPTGRFTPIGKIKPSDCDVWLAQYDFGIPSRNGAIWLLKDVFNMAVRDKALEKSPAEHLRAQRRKDPARPTPTFEEFRAIVASVRAQKLNGHGAEDSADFLEAQGMLGLGQAELSGITRADVNLEQGEISVKRRKTSKRFTVLIYPQARALIEKVCAGKRHNQPIFAIKNAKKALAAACERLSLPRFSQRSLRRMFITRAIQLGVDVKSIAEMEGHQDGGALILKTYSYVSRPHMRAMAQLLA